MANKISTSALAKKLNLSSKQLFQKFAEANMLCREDDAWQLTSVGKAAGGEEKSHSKYGDYVVWPETLTLENIQKVEDSVGEAKMLTATQVGKHFTVSANKINFILSELGWLEKALKGWKATPQGLLVGGVQKESFQTGAPYVTWPALILENKSLNSSMQEVLGTKNHHETEAPEAEKTEKVGFRDKFEAKHRSADGHYVRSRAEMLIDNWLYMAEIVHAYERRLPIEEEVYCDFYLPTGKVYIEFWGMESDPKYLSRKNTKKEVYAKHGFNLIELNDEDVLNLDDILPKKLLKFGIQAY